MENLQISPFKQAKAPSSSKISQLSISSGPKIPKNIFLRLSNDYVTNKAIARLKPHQSLFDASDEKWLYALWLKKVHRWNFFKGLDMSGQIIDELGEPNKVKMSFRPIRLFGDLKKFTLQSSWLRNKRVEDFTYELCHVNPNLEEVDLAFMSGKMLAYKKLRFILEDFDKYTPRLRKLTIWPQGYVIQKQYPVDAKSLGIIGSKLGKHAANLQHINLQLTEKRHITIIPVSDKQLKTFARNLAKKRKLKHLEIALYRFAKITDKGIEDFSRIICTGLNDLHSLELSFFHCKLLSISGLKALVTEICKHMKDLKSLNLSIELSKVNWKDLIAVSNHIKNGLPGLKRFILNKKDQFSSQSIVVT